MNIQQKRILDLFYRKSVKFKGFNLYFSFYYRQYNEDENITSEKLINLFINNFYIFRNRCVILIKNNNYSRSYQYDEFKIYNKDNWIVSRCTKPGKRNNGDKFDDSKFLDLISKIFKELEENRTFYINELKKVLLLK